MEIKDYGDLTGFVGKEFEKMQDLGIQRPSQIFIKYNEQTLMKYVKLYDSPLYRREKRKLALQEAIDTMPHGWLWKLFHPILWGQIKIMPEFKKEKKVKVKKTKEAQKSEINVPMTLPNPDQYPYIEDNETSNIENV